MNLNFFVTFPFLVFFLVTTPAWADDPAANVSEEQAIQAKALLDEGNKAQKAGDFEKAREAYRRSFNLKRSYDTAANLGQVEFYLKMYRPAAEHLDYARRNYPTSAKREGYSTIEALLEQITPHVGRVQVSADKPGATIFVDGEPAGSSPLNHVLFVDPGTNRVRAELEGESDSQVFESAKGSLVEVELKLSKGGATSPKEFASESDETMNSKPAMDRDRSKKNWVPAYILGSATVAALGTSLTFRGLSGNSSKKKDDAQSNLSDYACGDAGTAPASCRDVKKYGDRANQQATVSDATLIGTAVLGAVTLGYVLFTVGKKPSEGKPRASLSVERGGVSFSLLGQF